MRRESSSDFLRSRPSIVNANVSPSMMLYPGAVAAYHEKPP